MSEFYPFAPPNMSETDILANPAYHLRTINGAFLSDAGRSGEDSENTIFVGTILSYTTPNNTGSVYGVQAQSRNAASLVSPNKKLRTGIQSLSSSSKIMLLGDCNPRSGMIVCLVFTSSNTLYGAAGQTTFADTIRIGDVIGVVEPAVSTRTLGPTIPIVENWRRIVPMRQNLYIPVRSIRMSDQALQQIHFCDHALQVRFSLATLLTGTKVPCSHVTCDRQSSSCRGCRGIDETRQNYVVSVTVQIENQHEYDAVTGVATFDSFRSFRLTKLFMDVPAFRAIDDHTLLSFTSKLRQTVRSIQDYVNAHGGWTVIGWHRRGIVQNHNDGTAEVNSYTRGHLVRIEPTVATTAMKSHLSTMRLSPSLV